MKVGLVLPLAASDGSGATWPEIIALARHAEAGGIDSLWLYDHFFYRDDDGSETGYHEAWTILSALAAATERVGLGTLVLATGFRPAGLLAKMAVTADNVSRGRLILGLGCGWYEPEYRAFGYPFDHRVSRFEETLRILVPMLHGERVTFQGAWMGVEDAAANPPPARRIPVMVAAEGPRMLRLTAEFADQWQTAWFGRPNDAFRRGRDAMVAACDAAGRDPGTIEVTVGMSAGDADDDDALPLEVAALADAFSEWQAEGVDHVQLGLGGEKTAATFDIALEAVRRFRG
jgi:alkanesulfonate monooxygenase SsuD/methylene tetrahydromethanopterin reductase-like flavin-dependent oxidoreductase (luciferase family)